MGQQFLIDSNAVVDYLSGKLPQTGMAFMNVVVNDIPGISVISKIEVLGYKTDLEAYQLLTSFVNDSIIYALSDDIVEQTINIRKGHKIKTPDAIIASTAIVNGLTLITRNTKDFKNIEGLTIIDPYEL
ncbi:MAG: type II toxin-antitoxin system VapC family toxin [Mangrovibacterium sp.]